MIDNLEYAKRWLSRPIRSMSEKDTEILQLLVKEIENYRTNLSNPVAWAKTNQYGDMFDLRLQNNPYDDQNKVIPLYRLNND